MKKILTIFTVLFSVLAPLQAMDMMQPGHPPYRCCHDVLPTKNADESLQFKYELLKGANRSIEMATGYAQGEVFQQVLDIIADQLRNKPQLQVHMMMSEAADLISPDNRNYIHLLTTTYPDRFHALYSQNTGLIFQEKQLYTTENHLKLLIVDEKYFLLGGTNLVDSLSRSAAIDAQGAGPAVHFLPKGASDMDMVVSGPMAKKLREEFYTVFDMYKTNTSLSHSSGPYTPQSSEYFPVSDEEKASIAAFEDNPSVVRSVPAYAVISGPRFQLHEIGDLYTGLIKQAQSSIQLANMYFFPTQRLYDALLDAANRNIAITLITNTLNFKIALSNSTIALYAQLNRSNYFPMIMGRTYNSFQLIQAALETPKNVTIYEYNQEFILYHKKVMTVDGRHTVIGSYNLGSKSEDADFEVALFVDSAAVTAQVDQVLDTDKSRSNPVAWKQAYDWYFNPFHTIPSWAQNTFLDGIILDKMPPEAPK